MNYRQVFFIFVLGLLVGVVTTKLSGMVRIVAAVKPTPGIKIIIGTGGYLPDMRDTYGVGLNFAYHDFRNFDFSRVHLEDANFIKSNLSGVNFTDATITNANFTGASLKNAVILESVVSGENTLWSNTICPDGTNSDVNNGTCVGHFNRI